MSSVVPSLLLGVGPLVVEGHEESEDKGKNTVCQTDSVTFVISRSVGSWVDEGRDTATGVTDRNDDGGSDTLLQRSTDIVGSPRDDDGDKRVHARSGQEESDIVDGGHASDQKHQVAETTNSGEDHDDDTSFLDLVGPPSSTDSGDGSEDVWRDRKLYISEVHVITKLTDRLTS